MNVKSGVTGLSACALDPAAGVFECTCTRCLFHFALQWRNTITVIENQTKQNKTTTKKKDHRWRRLTQTSARHPTRHQWRCISGARSKWNSLLRSRDTLSNKRPCQEMWNNVLDEFALHLHFKGCGAEKKRRSEKQTGNDKYKRNLSHKICPQASVWTGCGQRHQSREAPPLASH